MAPVGLAMIMIFIMCSWDPNAHCWSNCSLPKSFSLLLSKKKERKKLFFYSTLESYSILESWSMGFPLYLSMQKKEYDQNLLLYFIGAFEYIHVSIIWVKAKYLQYKNSKLWEKKYLQWEMQKLSREENYHQLTWFERGGWEQNTCYTKELNYKTKNNFNAEI